MVEPPPSPAGRSTPIPDGRRHTRDLVECVAEASTCSTAFCRRETPERTALHQSGTSEHQERAIRRGRRAAGSGVPVLHVPAPFARVSRHLHLSGEMTAAALNTLHNLPFTLTPCRGSGRLLSLGPSIRSGRNSFGRCPAWLTTHDSFADPCYCWPWARRRGPRRARGCSSFRSCSFWASSIS